MDDQDDLAKLRQEFPPVDVGFAAKHGGRAEARRYNAARELIDPNDQKSIRLARRRLAATLLKMPPGSDTRKQ